MKFRQRSLPYPVVGNRDDVVGAAFQATLDFQVEKIKKVYLIESTIACSSSTLNDLIGSKQACFTIHVECSNTVYRRAFDFNEKTKCIEITADDLNGLVE